MISKFKEYILKVCKGVILMFKKFNVLLTDITHVAILGWLSGTIRRVEMNTKDNWSTGVLDWKIFIFI